MYEHWPDIAGNLVRSGDPGFARHLTAIRQRDGDGLGICSFLRQQEVTLLLQLLIQAEALCDVCWPRLQLTWNIWQAKAVLLTVYIRIKRLGCLGLGEIHAKKFKSRWVFPHYLFQTSLSLLLLLLLLVVVTVFGVWGFNLSTDRCVRTTTNRLDPPHSSRVPFYRRHRTFSAVKVWPHCHTAISGKGEVGFVMRVVSLCCFCCVRSSVQFGKRTQLFLIGSMIPQYLYSIRYFPK